MTRASTCTSTLRMNSKDAKIFEDIVLLEGGDWSFVCIVNKKVRVPKGEEGLLFMRKFLKENYKAKKAGDAPFTGGFVGFLSYDLGVKWQGVKQRVKKDKMCPSAHFVYTDNVIAIPSGTLAGSREGYAKIPTPSSNITYKEYAQKLRAIKKYLFSGDTYQVNFSQRFTAPFSGNAFDLYRKITKINPSPFQFFMETPKFAVVSNSPERLFRIGPNGIIETCPIKGTVPRGKTAAEDRANIKRLMKSEKEHAELSMIVDLERNDLGKICVPGSVKVTDHRAVEKYSHVIHTVSKIRGKLERKCDWLDALHALFPGGSITGCPKKRTVEIIDELEDYERGVYCGSAGYVDLSGECDFNIMIRTLFLDKVKNRPGAESQRLIFNSGGGIVVDSDPKKEYEETLHKAKALTSAIMSDA